MGLKKLIKKIKNRFNKYKIEPVSVTIDISNRCNALCPFCSRQISDFKRAEFMSKEMFYDIIEEISQIKTIKQIVFAAWGEPLLHPNFDEFANYVLSKGYNFSFPTNMQLADKHFDTLLKASHIMISVEGHDKESYEKNRVNLKFEKTYENIIELDRLIKEKKAVGEKVPFREINFLLTKESKVNEYINLWGNYVDIIRIGPVLPVILWNKEKQCTEQRINNELKDKLLPINDFVKNMFCAQPFKSIIIRANGKLALCCSDYDIDYDFGTYKDLKNTYWNNENLNKVRKQFKTKKLDICKNCFQNFEIKKEILFKELPELQNYENKSNIVIYTNR